eukprot:472181-Rhodomonas_salina.1
MVLCCVRYWNGVWSYAMCGTGMAYGAVCLRMCYAMCGTVIAYGTMRDAVLAWRMVLSDMRYNVSCYAVCASRDGVARDRRVKREEPRAYGAVLRYPIAVSSYAVCSTAIAYDVVRR